MAKNAFVSFSLHAPTPAQPVSEPRSIREGDGDGERTREREREREREKERER
jgi:hypothetical protein